MAFEFRHFRAGAYRDIFGIGIADPLDYGLLKDKRVAELLSLSRQDKDVLLDLATNVVLARPKGSESPWFEVHVRNLCHSTFCTADYLSISERFNMKQCVLILGDWGTSKQPWAEFIKIALYLYDHEFNVIWFEVPEFASDPIRSYNYGPGLIKGLLNFLGIDQVNVLGHGLGAGIFLTCLPQMLNKFAKTHMLFNPNLPGQNNIDAHAIDQALHKQELQLWIAYHDMPPKLDRNKDTGYGRTFSQVLKIQTRCLGDQRKGKRILHFDEVILSEDFKDTQLKRATISLHPVYVPSEEFLRALSKFFELPPEARQIDMVEGLPGSKTQNTDNQKGGNIRRMSKLAEAGGELPALRQLREQLEGGVSIEDAQNAGSTAHQKRVETLRRATKMLSLMKGTGSASVAQSSALGSGLSDHSQSAPSLAALGNAGMPSASSTGQLALPMGAPSSSGHSDRGSVSTRRSGKKKDKKDKHKKALLERIQAAASDGRSSVAESSVGEGSVAGSRLRGSMSMANSMALTEHRGSTVGPTEFLNTLTEEEQENPRLVEAARLDAKLLDAVREESREHFQQTINMQEKKAAARSLADEKARIEGPKRILAAAKAKSEKDEQHARLMRDEEGQIRAVMQASVKEQELSSIQEAGTPKDLGSTFGSMPEDLGAAWQTPSDTKGAQGSGSLPPSTPDSGAGSGLRKIPPPPKSPSTPDSGAGSGLRKIPPPPKSPSTPDAGAGSGHRIDTDIENPFERSHPDGFNPVHDTGS